MPTHVSIFSNNIHEAFSARVLQSASELIGSLCCWIMLPTIERPSFDFGSCEQPHPCVHDATLEDEWHHSPSTFQGLLSKSAHVPFVRTMSCYAQIDRYKYQCAGNSAIKPLTGRRGHASNRQVNNTLRKVMRCDCRMESRVSGKFVVGLSIFVVGASRLERCEIGVAVVLDAGCEQKEGERDESPY